MRSDEGPTGSPKKGGALYRDLRRGVALTATLLALVTGGIQAAVIKLLHLEDSLTLLGVFLKTAPLTLALTLSFLVWSLWAERSKWGGFAGWIVFTGLALFMAAWIGNAAGALRVEIPAPAVNTDLSGTIFDGLPQPTEPPASNGGPLQAVADFWVVRALRGYYRAYGSASFWSSVILSGFLVYACHRIIDSRAGKDA